MTPSTSRYTPSNRPAAKRGGVNSASTDRAVPGSGPWQVRSLSKKLDAEVYNVGTLLPTFGPVHRDMTGRTWDVFDIEWPSLQITPLGATTMATSSGGFCFP